MTWLLVGLGNPGPTYAFTRHNVGYMTVDELASRAGVRFTAPRGMHAEVAEGRLTPSGIVGVGVGDKVILAKPRTFMNESGQAVRKLATFFKVDPDHVVAIHDELDLDLGQLRVKFGGGDNGHNGLKSMRAHLGSGDFFRVRFGIGRPSGRQEAADYVLSTIPSAMRESIALEVDRAADATESLLLDGLDDTQNRFNS